MSTGLSLPKRLQKLKSCAKTLTFVPKHLQNGFFLIFDLQKGNNMPVYTQGIKFFVLQEKRERPNKENRQNLQKSLLETLTNSILDEDFCNPIGS